MPQIWKKEDTKTNKLFYFFSERINYKVRYLGK